MKKISIAEYRPEFQEGIDKMMAGIQDEFREQITTSHSTMIHQVYQLPGQKYWVAFHNGRVAGTIGLVLFSANNAVVKRMMVDKDFRGSDFQTASLLMNTAFDWGKQHGAKRIYLGTMAQFKAAQKFYVKNGFVPIQEEELPADYPANPMDTLFYKLIF